jgi:hypothetical protein
VRAAVVARSVGDYAGMMATGIVVRKLRSVGHGKDARVVEEYEIDNAAVEALNSIEKRAAIEAGQEQENINLSGQISKAGIDAAKVFTIEELEQMKARYEAKFEEERQAKAQAKLLPAPGER